MARQPTEPLIAPPTTPARFQPKPDWALREVIRLRALMPADSGCRTLAEQFNRLHGGRRDGVTVGRTWVAEKTRQHRYAILQMRRELKHRTPRPIPINHTWAMDLTGLPDQARQSHRVLGILDHGSRWLVSLRHLKSKASIALLRALLDAIEAVGAVPGYLRTDNEAVFTSRLFRFGLWWLGIRHQRTDKGCPWQNGRIERLFGTLKAKAKGLLFHEGGLPEHLAQFQFWYNHVRPHQHLDGRTPFEALNRMPVTQCSDQHPSPSWFEAWHGRLAGYWMTTDPPE